jgi:hypothetical protein
MSPEVLFVFFTSTSSLLVPPPSTHLNHYIDILKSRHVQHNMDSKLRCIGKGFCGSVWAANDEINTQAQAIKREDGGPGRSLTNDFNMHVKTSESITHFKLTTPLLIPKCYGLINDTDDAWWRENLSKFPPGYTRCKSLISERIPAFSRPVRERLVDNFCPSELADFIKSNPGDADSLVRPYLGRRRIIRPSRFRRFSLRNYPLHLDQMELLGLPTESYARAMAEALALMHWGANVDGNDVEFVLAPPRGGEGSRQRPFSSDVLGTHAIWMLDFDCCRSMSLDLAGVEQACNAFFKNDPFFPRPSSTSEDQQLWTVFHQKYLETSKSVVGNDGSIAALPDLLISMIEKRVVEMQHHKGMIERD